jgi:hypothetical protein
MARFEFNRSRLTMGVRSDSVSSGNAQRQAHERIVQRARPLRLNQKNLSQSREGAKKKTKED